MHFWYSFAVITAIAGGASAIFEPLHQLAPRYEEPKGVRTKCGDLPDKLKRKEGAIYVWQRIDTKNERIGTDKQHPKLHELYDKIDGAHMDLVIGPVGKKGSAPKNLERVGLLIDSEFGPETPANLDGLPVEPYLRPFKQQSGTKAGKCRFQGTLLSTGEIKNANDAKEKLGAWLESQGGKYEVDKVDCTTAVSWMLGQMKFDRKASGIDSDDEDKCESGGEGPSSSKQTRSMDGKHSASCKRPGEEGKGKKTGNKGDEAKTHKTKGSGDKNKSKNKSKSKSKAHQKGQAGKGSKKTLH